MIDYCFTYCFLRNWVSQFLIDWLLIFETVMYYPNPDGSHSTSKGVSTKLACSVFAKRIVQTVRESAHQILRSNQNPVGQAKQDLFPGCMTV